MTFLEFNSQMQRLTKTFGKTPYSEERIALIWKAVSNPNLSAAWFERAIDHLIGSMRQPPLLPEFQEQISRELEREWQKTKERGHQEAKDFWDGTYQTEDMRTICAMINKRMFGHVDDEMFAQFLKHLDSASKANSKQPYDCDYCFDTGVYLAFQLETKARFVFRCHCRRGVSDPRKHIPHFTEHHSKEFVWADYSHRIGKQHVPENDSKT